MSAPLKPCPFCGGAAEFEQDPFDADKDTRVVWTVGCNDEGCIGYLPRKFFSTKGEAQAAWDKRGKPAPEAVAWHVLLSLTNSADGLSFREAEIRQIIGNTNWAALRTHIEAARVVLSAPTAPATAGPSVIGEIAVERHRQITIEQWTPEHDDHHADGEIAQAASCYAGYASGAMSLKQVEGTWPWGHQWWKPSDDPRRDYIKGAALLVAEIERIDRAKAGAL